MRLVVRNHHIGNFVINHGVLNTTITQTALWPTVHMMHMLGINPTTLQHRPGLWSTEALAASRIPSHGRNQHTDSHCRARIVHVARIDGVRAGEVERDARKCEVQKSQKIQEKTESQRICSALQRRPFAGPSTPESNGKRQHIGQVKAFSGNGQDGTECGDGPEVDGHECAVDHYHQDDSIDRDLTARIDLAEETGERKSAITRKRKCQSRALSAQEGQGDEADDGDLHGKHHGGCEGVGGVEEDLKDGHAGRADRGVVDIANAEADGDEEYKAGDGADPDGPDDRFGGVFAGVFHFFGHMRGCVYPASVSLKKTTLPPLSSWKSTPLRRKVGTHHNQSCQTHSAVNPADLHTQCQSPSCSGIP